MLNNVLILITLFTVIIIFLISLFKILCFIEKHSKFSKRMFYILGSFDSDPFSDISHKNIKNYIKILGFNKNIENYLLVVFSSKNVKTFNKKMLDCKGNVKLKTKLIKKIIPSPIVLALKIFG